MIRAVALCFAVAIAPVMASADANFTRLYDALEMDAYIGITREEGMDDFGPLSQDMLGQDPDTVLTEQVKEIYDPARMRNTVETEMQKSLTGNQIEGAVLFFTSATGQRIVELELAARRAMTDPSVEEAARHAWALAEEEKPWMVARIKDLVEASDLVDRNVAGALNSNLRFYEGLADGGSLQLSESEMLTEVWAQEPSIREDTADWIGAYLLLSYQPLSDADIHAYITFWRSPPGKALNAAMFEGFNQLYDDISYATARILALRIGSQEL
ncbi:MAG: DUF2059 domain-containing protein [Aliishimia sp.]